MVAANGKDLRNELHLAIIAYAVQNGAREFLATAQGGFTNYLADNRFITIGFEVLGKVKGFVFRVVFDKPVVDLSHLIIREGDNGALDKVCVLVFGLESKLRIFGQVDVGIDLREIETFGKVVAQAELLDAVEARVVGVGFWKRGFGRVG